MRCGSLSCIVKVVVATVVATKRAGGGGVRVGVVVVNYSCR